jgi:L,D-peptidoglycan transpeptidase YkuD (ErfK/YbiS/YcfS/YnhG family)
MGKFVVKICLVVLSCLYVVVGHAQGNLSPFYNFDEKPKPKKTKPAQQVAIPRFPPQFRSRDTIGGKKSPALMTKADSIKAKNTKPLLQAAAKPKLDTVYKVISTKVDAGGNEIKELEAYVNGVRKFKETLITANANQLNLEFNIDTINSDSVSIQVVKKNQRMYVYHKHKFLTSYKVVFGKNFMQQKMKEGDKATPEGFFKLTERHPNKDWTLFMGFDYPNSESRKIFEENKKNGFVSAADRIGGNVGIHGCIEDGDLMIDQRFNWTDGCIAMKKNDLLELSKITKSGTIIHIRRSAEKDFNYKIAK